MSSDFEICMYILYVYYSTFIIYEKLNRYYAVDDENSYLFKANMFIVISAF